MSIKLCQTKPEFYTESKTHEKRDGMRKGRGVIKREDEVNEGGFTVLQFSSSTETQDSSFSVS